MVSLTYRVMVFAERNPPHLHNGSHHVLDVALQN